LSNPQLVVRDDLIAVVYCASRGAFLRRGTLRAGIPELGDPIKITSHTAPLVSASPLLTSGDRIAFLCGSDTVWKQTASLDALLESKSD
jgi:hypothetical protein